MPITPRDFPIPLVALILLAAPLGCNSDAPGRPGAEAGGDATATRPASTGRNEAIPPPLDAGPAPGAVGGQGRRGLALKEIPQDIRQAALVVEEGFGEIKGEVTRAVGAAPTACRTSPARSATDASRAAVQVEGGMREAVDKVVDGVQTEVEGVKDDVRQRARSIQDDVKQSAQGLRKNVIDGLFGPLPAVTGTRLDPSSGIGGAMDLVPMLRVDRVRDAERGTSKGLLSPDFGVRSYRGGPGGGVALGPGGSPPRRAGSRRWRRGP
jgi:hypothetical protein